MIEKSKEKMTESNGMVQNCEKYSDKECLVEKSSPDGSFRPKASTSCSDLLILCQPQPRGNKPELEQTASVADFTIPYNIINNYFSGLYTPSTSKRRFCLHEKRSQSVDFPPKRFIISSLLLLHSESTVGVDAAICVKFHLEREKNPHKFNSRMKNKLWYFEYATSETFSATCKNLHEFVELTCDGVQLDLNGKALQGIALLNIPYTHGGSNLWGENLSQKRLRRSTSAHGPFKRMRKLRAADKDLSTQSFNSVDLSIAIQGISNFFLFMRGFVEYPPFLVQISAIIGSR